MPRPDLEAIRSRLAAATPGPWEADHAVVVYEGPNQGKQSRAVYARPTPSHIIEIVESPDELHGECIHSERDWRFIAHSWSDVMALLAYIEELESQIRRKGL